MRFRIHFTYDNGYEDCIDIEGDSVEEIEAEADEQIQMRGVDRSTCWSEEM